jgi:non-ribosomal peptide synthetase component E (peptide arylation enzyme)
MTIPRKIPNGIRSHRQPGDANRFRQIGVWGDHTLAEIVDHHAAAAPDKLAVADQHVRWSYAEFTDMSKRMAQVLLNLGVKPNDPVVSQLPSCTLLPLIHIAANRIGALYVPASDRWRQSELGSLLLASKTRVLIAAPRDRDFDLRMMHSEVQSALPDPITTVYVRSGEPGSLEELLAKSRPISTEDAVRLRPDPDAPAHVMASSGTTGMPKAAVWGGNDLVALLKHHFRSAIQLHPDDTAGGLAPANVGSTGYVFPVLAPLLVGASSVLLEKWSPTAALDFLAVERCTYATAIPTQMAMLLDEPALSKVDLPVLTRFNNAGATLPAHVAEQVEGRMGVRVQSVYGASDGGVPTLTSIDDPVEKRRTTVGRRLVAQEVQLRDPFGEAVSDGAEGEIWWRGANKSFGYLNQPDYEVAVWDDQGWYRSGDIGTFDDDGYLRITGRAKEMINRGGLNIFPSELEEILVAHPQVATIAVVGVPDERLGERTCAVVVPTSPELAPRLADLVDMLTKRGVAQFKHPEFIVCVDAIPLNLGGKADRRALSKLVEDVSRG